MGVPYIVNEVFAFYAKAAVGLVDSVYALTSMKRTDTQQVGFSETHYRLILASNMSQW